MILLLLVQVVIIAVDITLIVIDLAGYVSLKVSIHSFVYCIKLEMEFVVLNQLVELSKMGVPGIPSFQPALSSACRPDDTEAANKKDSPQSFVRELASRRATMDSCMDMESLESTSSQRTLAFITTPPHLETEQCRIL